MTSQKLSPSELYAFQIMLDFVSDIKNCFGHQKHSAIKAMNLYHRLISKMSFEDKSLITKHIELFKNFCTRNREQIHEKDFSFILNRIEFTERIYIDMTYIFKLASKDTDESTSKTMWEYIWSLSALLDSESKTKQLLTASRETECAHSVEHCKNNSQDDFLSGMMKTIGQSFAGMQMPSSGGSPSPNPMEMMAGLMGSGNGNISGLVNSLQTNLQNGNIDLTKLMGTMQTMVETVQTEIEKTDDPMLKNMVSMLTSAMPNTSDIHPLNEENAKTNTSQSD